MPDQTWTYNQLFEGLDPSPGFVAELEKLGLLSVVAHDAKGKKIYGPGSREQLDKVLSLVELGYRPKDIAAIAKRVGLPEQAKRKLFRKPPTYLRLADVARRSSVEPAVVQTWIEAGLLVAAVTTEGGEPLFDRHAMDRARSLADLTTLGLSPEAVLQWATLGPALQELTAETGKVTARSNGPRDDTSQEVLDQLATCSATLVLFEAQMERWKGGLRRWDGILAGHHKMLDRLRRLHGLDPAQKRPRRRLRRRHNKTTRR